MKVFLITVLSGLVLIGGLLYYGKTQRAKDAAAFVVLDNQCKVQGHKGARKIRDWDVDRSDIYCIRQDDSLEPIKADPAPPIPTRETSIRLDELSRIGE